MFYDLTTKILSNAIAIFSPRRAAKYVYERTLLKKSFKRDYDAAKKTGVNKGWIPSNKSGTYENYTNGKFVRARARDLARNNAYIVGSIKKILANTIGSDLTVKFSIKKPDGKLDSSLNSELEDRFNLWREECTLDGKTFQDALEMIERGAIVDGEVLINNVLIPEKTKNPYKIQVLETDYLSSEKIEGGIEYDKYNKPKFFHLYKSYPEVDLYSVNPKSSIVRLPAENVIFVYRSDRASTYRGISELAPIIMGMYSIDQLEAAEMSAIRSASAFGVIVTSPFSTEILSRMYDEEKITVDDEDEREMYVRPGAFHFLRPGEDAKAFKNDRPNANLIPFIDELLYKNSSAFGLAAEEMTNNYSKVNYSSARQSSLVAKKLYLARRADAVRRYLNKIVRNWLFYEVLTGSVKRLSYNQLSKNYARYTKFYFTFPGFDWIDPLKEIVAIEKEIQLGINSRQSVCSEKNRNFYNIVDQLSEEKDYMKSKQVYGDDPTVTQVQTESESTSVSKVEKK